MNRFGKLFSLPGRVILICVPAVIWVLLAGGCSRLDIPVAASLPRRLNLASRDRINTLDPVLAADLASAYMVSHLYDTLLQYDYAARPYRLSPSMLAEMPEISSDVMRYDFHLRDDLYFSPDPCFPDGARRRITSTDIIFSIKRLADIRNHSPGWWLLRGKIAGLDDFREKCAAFESGDISVYDEPCDGLEIIDDSHFRIHLTRPDPRLLYAFAMPYTAIVPREAVEKYGRSFAERALGSGPFILAEWQRDYRLILRRNPDYRIEFYSQAENPADRSRALPLLDEIVIHQVRESLSSWLMFLQGELDLSALDRDNFDAVVDDNQQLIQALRDRGIKMLRTPEFQINYIGFSFSDPRLAENVELRRAISLAYDVGKRVKLFNYRLIQAHGPIPPGVDGYDKNLINPYSAYNLDAAKKHLAAAGYPDGIDPATKRPLSLSFDLGQTGTSYRQLAELMVQDMAAIGIEIKPSLNHKTRFFQKLRQGQMQLFRLSWIGDYPDAENFLQLFYGSNAGSCNRANYQDEKFDRMYEKIITMPDSEERSRAYREMAEYLTHQCPWIFESFPVSYQLTHAWLENFLHHDFPYARWKYLNVDPTARRAAKASFKPLSMRELRR